MTRGTKRGSAVAGPRCVYCGYLLTSAASIQRGFGYRCGVANGRLRRPGRPRAPRPVWGLSRGDVRGLVACPVCPAGIGEHCRIRAGGLREVNHLARTDAAADLLSERA